MSAASAQASFEKEVWPVPVAEAEPEFPQPLPTQTLLAEAVWAPTAGAVAWQAREYGGSRFGNLGSSGLVDQQSEVLRTNENPEERVAEKCCEKT